MKNLSLFPLDYSMIEIESRNFQAMEWKEQDKTNIICTTRHKVNKEKKSKHMTYNMKVPCKSRFLILGKAYIEVQRIDR